MWANPEPPPTPPQSGGALKAPSLVKEGVGGGRGQNRRNPGKSCRRGNTGHLGVIWGHDPNWLFNSGSCPQMTQMTYWPLTTWVAGIFLVPMRRMGTKNKNTVMFLKVVLFRRCSFACIFRIVFQERCQIHISRQA